MDSFEFTKIAGSVLAALLVIFGTKVIIEQRLAPHGEEVVGYRLPTDTAAEKPTKTAEAPAAPAPSSAPQPAPAAPAAPAPAAANGQTAAAPPPAQAPAAPASPAPAPSAGGFDAKAVAAMIATASVDDGAAVFRKCATCHANKKDAPSTVAPNLWNIVGRPKASLADYQGKYSDGMKAKGGEWSYESLAEFVHKPKGYVPGTKMIFAGINDKGEIANLIAYLRTLADSPAPLPN